jgi:ArsR family transcriptional regulator
VAVGLWQSGPQFPAAAFLAGFGKDPLFSIGALHNSTIDDLYIALVRYIYRIMTIEGNEDSATGLDEGIKALAHPVRRAILAKLGTPERYFAGQAQPLSLGVCAGQIEQSCPLSQSSISAHLAALQAAGLILGRRVGPYVFFKRDDEAIERLLTLLRGSIDQPVCSSENFQSS